MLIDYSIVTYYVLGIGSGSTANKALKLIGKTFDANGYVIAVNKGSSSGPTLQKELNKALTILKNNGALKKIYQEWGLWNDQQAQIGVK